MVQLPPPISNMVSPHPMATPLPFKQLTIQAMSLSILLFQDYLPLLFIITVSLLKILVEQPTVLFKLSPLPILQHLLPLPFLLHPIGLAGRIGMVTAHPISILQKVF